MLKIMLRNQENPLIRLIKSYLKEISLIVIYIFFYFFLFFFRKCFFCDIRVRMTSLLKAYQNKRSKEIFLNRIFFR